MSLLPEKCSHRSDVKWMNEYICEYPNIGAETFCNDCICPLVKRKRVQGALSQISRNKKGIVTLTLKTGQLSEEEVTNIADSNNAVATINLRWRKD